VKAKHQERSTSAVRLWLFHASDTRCTSEAHCWYSWKKKVITAISNASVPGHALIIVLLSLLVCLIRDGSLELAAAAVAGLLVVLRRSFIDRARVLDKYSVHGRRLAAKLVTLFDPTPRPSYNGKGHEDTGRVYVPPAAPKVQKKFIITPANHRQCRWRGTKLMFKSVRGHDSRVYLFTDRVVWIGRWYWYRFQAEWLSNGQFGDLAYVYRIHSYIWSLFFF
jgi:hypothetical protein